MRKLVSYGSDSDEEPSQSPKRRSSTQKYYDDDEFSPVDKRRKDSEYWSEHSSESPENSRPASRDEPPPPKRHGLEEDHSPSPLAVPGSEPSFGNPKEAKGKLPVAHSTSSLVSMGVEDEFDKEFQENQHRPRRVSRIEGGVEEPEPPKRKTMDEDMSVDRSPDESDVDQALQEGLNALKEKTRYMEDESSTPRSPMDSDDATPKTPETPAKTDTEKEILLPPSPPGEVSHQVQGMFERYWRFKDSGKDMNANIKNQKKFKNPSIYDTLIQRFGLDEIGTNFPKNVFDPHAFDESSYYEELAEAQKRLMDSQAAKAAKKNTPDPQTIAAAKSKISSVVKEHEKKRGK